MIQAGLLDDPVGTIIDAVSSRATSVLAPFASLWDFATTVLPLWLIVLAIVMLCVLAGWFFGATVRWFLGWVVTAAIAAAAGATWMWLKLRRKAPPAKPKPQPADPPTWPPSWWG